MTGHRIVAGIGCRRGCPADEIVAVVRAACQQAGQRADALAAPAFKAREAGLREAATVLGLELILVSAPDLARAQSRCITRSAAAERSTGVASVAEGSAIAASGMGGRLILPRIAQTRATCALAQCVTPASARHTTPAPAQCVIRASARRATCASSKAGS
jgi:cobalt-precorrin 5A hydrolase